jgi:hypothetical protein
MVPNDGNVIETLGLNNPADEYDDEMGLIGGVI